jgi:hypothetical protein
VAGESPADHQVQTKERSSVVNGVIWTAEEKMRLVQLDIEERQKGYGFMSRLKDRWDSEYPNKTHLSRQNLRDNAARFSNESRKSIVVRHLDASDNQQQQAASASQTNLKATWTNEMKVKLVRMEVEERSRGWGFMKRLKQRWDSENLDSTEISAQCLRDNASRFKRDQAVQNLLMVMQPERDTAEHRVENGDSRAQVTRTEENEANIPDCLQTGMEATDELSGIIGGEEHDVEMWTEFMAELEKLDTSTLKDMSQRKPLRKIRASKRLLNRADVVLQNYFDGKEDNIQKITDATYAMAKTLEKYVGCKEQTGNCPYRENGRIRRLRVKISSLRRLIAKISNEMDRRRNWRKMTWKERAIVNELKKESGNDLKSGEALAAAKEAWIDRRRMYEVKLQKAIKKDKQLRNNRTFKLDEGKLYRQMNKIADCEGTTPSMDKFVEFWGSIWEDNSCTPKKEWMEEIGQQLEQKVHTTDELVISESSIQKVMMKRKNWSAPGIDGIPNYYWKNLKATWKPLCKAMCKWVGDNGTMPDWLTVGRTVLIPKTQDLSSERDYRPITCLNTSYKLFTGILARYLKKHADQNNIWDESQMGTCDKVLGTVDQLLIDNCIMDEVRSYHRDLAVAYYDYQKAYDKVHHDWVLRVFKWIGIPEAIIKIIEHMMSKWKVKLEVRNGSEKDVSRWIHIRRGFLQGDSFSPVGFCLTEIPVSMLIQQTDGYKMGAPGERNVKRTHSLFIDDLKVYQTNHARLEMVNNMIVQASTDTGACYGVKKCAEAVFKRGKMIRGEGLVVGEERMTALNPLENEMYKFLGCEQAEGMAMQNIKRRLQRLVRTRTEELVGLELYDKNLIKAINCRVIPVAGYMMNVCKFSKEDLNELDGIVKRVLRDNKMHARQASDERLFLERAKGGRGLKSFKDVYLETKVRVASYMVCSDSKWIKAAWKRELSREGSSLRREAETALSKLELNVRFYEDRAVMDGDDLPVSEGYRTVWKRLRQCMKAKRTEHRVKRYGEKPLQSDVFKRMAHTDFQWMECNNDPKKVAAIINMQEQMVETAGWKTNRGLPVASDLCRLCNDKKETVYHWISGCRKMAATEYTRRHDNALKILSVEWCKVEGLLGADVTWYKEKWERGHILENETRKLCWDFEYSMRFSSTCRRPDLTIEYKDLNLIYLVDMACPHDSNVRECYGKKREKYQQLCFELRERRRGYRVEVLPLIIGCMGSGAEELTKQVRKLLKEEKNTRWTVREMMKTVVWESESIVRKVLSGVIQTEG